MPLFIRYNVAYKKETGVCRLEISMTFADDAGEYVILAKSQLGEVSASTSLLEEGMSTNTASKKYHDEVHERRKTYENQTKMSEAFKPQTVCCALNNSLTLVFFCRGI